MTRARPRAGKLLTAKFTQQLDFPDKAATGLVLVSIAGNKSCASEYLQAILQGLTNFKQCTVLIADAIYWHNLKMKGMDELTENEIENLKGEALHLGDLFIKDNLKYFLLALNCPLGSFHRDFRLNEDSPADDCIQAINYLAKEKNFRVVRWNEWVSKIGRAHV